MTGCSGISCGEARLSVSQALQVHSAHGPLRGSVFLQELATVFIERLDVKVLLINNQHLGMVVQWEDRFYKVCRGHTGLHACRGARLPCAHFSRSSTNGCRPTAHTHTWAGATPSGTSAGVRRTSTRTSCPWRAPSACLLSVWCTSPTCAPPSAPCWTRPGHTCWRWGGAGVARGRVPCLMCLAPPLSGHGPAHRARAAHDPRRRILQGDHCRGEPCARLAVAATLVAK